MIRFITDSSQEPEKVVRLSLKSNVTGSVELVARSVDGKIESTLLVFHPDGSVEKIGFVSQELGFVLDVDRHLDIFS